MKKHNHTAHVLATYALLIIAAPLIWAQGASAQAVNCPIGYTCTPVNSNTSGTGTFNNGYYYSNSGYTTSNGAFTNGNSAYTNANTGYTNTGVTTATTANTSSSCYVFNNNLTTGNSGPDVSALQSFLASKGYSIPVTGYFGSLTAKAVLSFQMALHISSEAGAVGPQTRSAINALCGNQTPTAPSGTVTTATAFRYDMPVTSPATNDTVYSTGSTFIRWTYPNELSGKTIQFAARVISQTQFSASPLSSNYLPGIIIAQSTNNEPIFSDSNIPKAGTTLQQNINAAPAGQYVVLITAYDPSTGITHAGVSGMFYLVTGASQTGTNTGNTNGTASADIKALGVDSPSAVTAGSTFNVSWTSYNTTYCTSAGSNIPLAYGAGTWGTGTRLGTSGSQNVVAPTVGSSIYFDIQCYKADGTSVTDRVTVPLSTTVAVSQNKDIYWSGGTSNSKVQIGLIDTRFDTLNSIILGWITLNGGSSGSVSWSNQFLTDLTGTSNWKASNLSQGPFRIIAVTAGANGSYCTNRADSNCRFILSPSFDLSNTSPITLAFLPTPVTITNYASKPYISYLSPSTGTANQIINAYGSGFTQSSMVLIGDNLATSIPAYVSPDGTNLRFMIASMILGPTIANQYSIRVSNVGNVSVSSGQASNVAVYYIPQAPGTNVPPAVTAGPTTTFTLSTNSIAVTQFVTFTSNTVSPSTSLKSASIDQSTDNVNWTSGLPCAYWNSSTGKDSSHVITCSTAFSAAGTYYFRSRGLDANGSSNFAYQTLVVTGGTAPVATPTVTPAPTATPAATTMATPRITSTSWYADDSSTWPTLIEATPLTSTQSMRIKDPITGNQFLNQSNGSTFAKLTSSPAAGVTQLQVYVFDYATGAILAPQYINVTITNKPTTASNTGANTSAFSGQTTAATCTDSDSSQDPNVLGTIRDSSGYVFTDSSANSNGASCSGDSCTAVIEGYCTAAGKVASALMFCSSGYSANGVCATKPVAPLTTIMTPTLSALTWTASEPASWPYVSEAGPVSANQAIRVKGLTGDQYFSQQNGVRSGKLTATPPAGTTQLETYVFDYVTGEKIANGSINITVH